MAKNTTKNSEKTNEKNTGKNNEKNTDRTIEKNTEKKTASLEDRLLKLETLSEEIRRNDIPLDEALKAFEEGIKLARSLEKDLEKIQNRIEILMNNTESAKADSPELELFDSR